MTPIPVELSETEKAKHSLEYDLMISQIFRRENKVSDSETDSESPCSRKRRASSSLDEDDVSQEGEPADEWTPEAHRSFVSAIYDVGLKHASPSLIRESMVDTPDCITNERVKSHLQKHRLNRVKGKEDFMSAYDHWMKKACCLTNSKQFAAADFMSDAMSSSSLPAGERAALLSYSIMMNYASRKKACIDHPSFTEDRNELNSTLVHDGNELLGLLSEHVAVSFPNLTADEEISPLGMALCNVKDMFRLMTTQIENARESGDGAVAPQVEGGGDTYDSLPDGLSSPVLYSLSTSAPPSTANLLPNSFSLNVPYPGGYH